MNGQNLAEAAHSALILAPQTISGGATAQAFHLKSGEHASIYILFGAEGGSPAVVPTSIVVNQCTTAAGASATALPGGFRYYYSLLGGAGNDVLNGIGGAPANAPGKPPNYATSSGITSFPASISNLMYIIEIDSAELESSLVDVVGTIVEYPYLQVVIANGAYATYCAILVVVTGMRWAWAQSPSITT